MSVHHVFGIKMADHASQSEKVDRNKIVENDGQYGVMKNKSRFNALTNFILRVDGYVERKSRRHWLSHQGKTIFL